MATGGKSFFTGHSEFTVNDMTPGATNTVRLEGGNSRVFLENITVTPFNDADDETPSVTGITLSGDYKTVYQMGDRWWYDNGAMAANTWIGKYYVNGSGVWTKTR